MFVFVLIEHKSILQTTVPLAPSSVRPLLYLLSSVFAWTVIWWGPSVSARCSVG